MMKFSTTVARMLAAGMLLVLACSAVAQQAYPSKPMRLITPYPPGGGTTIVARLIGQKLTESWGQQVLVDNRPGGNTIIGNDAVAKAPPDGYTILYASSTTAILPSLFSNLPYDTIKDFAPVATLVNIDYVLVVHPSIQASNLKELIALARAKPEQLNYGSTGSGGVQHLAGESLNIMARIKMQHIPYKGSGQLLPDLIGGQVQLSFQVPLNAITHIKSGKLKAIAISGDKRLPALPQVSTFTEAGLPGFEVNTWQGIVAPAGTPRGIIGKLSTEVAKILVMPDIKEKLLSQGADPFISTPDQFAALMKADMVKYARVIKTANIKADE